MKLKNYTNLFLDDHLSYSFLLLLLAVLLVDEIPQFYSWQSRIKIGRYTDHEIWQQKVTNKAILWLNNTPLIPIKDYTRGLIFQMLRKKYASKNIQSWQKASLLLGAIHSFEKQNSEQIKKKSLIVSIILLIILAIGKIHLKK